MNCKEFCVLGVKAESGPVGKAGLCIMEYEEAISFQNLLKALKRCIKGTLWKESTAKYWHNRLKNTYKLRKELLKGLYRISQYLWFVITEPKEREIFASYIKDRQLQHALIDNIVYPAVTQHFIHANCACQRGKGTKFFIDLMLEQIRKFARVHGNEGYVLQLDIKKFFASTEHDIVIDCISQYVDEKTAKACADVIRSFIEIEFAKLLMAFMDKKTAHRFGHKIAIAFIYEGDIQKALKGLTKQQAEVITERIRQGNFKGVGLGSQVTQTTQLTLLNGLDHYIVEELHIEVYGRYMDDAALVHESKDYLKYCKIKIAEFLGILKLVLNKKTQLFPLKQGLTILHWHIKVTYTGKVVIHKHKRKINKQRRKLRKQKKLLDAGQMTMQDIETSFQCWQAGILQQKCYKQVLNMRRYYWYLFERRAPEWNPKTRRLKKSEEIIIFSTCEAGNQETYITGGWTLFPEMTWTKQQRPQEPTAIAY